MASLWTNNHDVKIMEVFGNFSYTGGKVITELIPWLPECFLNTNLQSRKWNIGPWHCVVMELQVRASQIDFWYIHGPLLERPKGRLLKVIRIIWCDSDAKSNKEASRLYSELLPSHADDVWMTCRQHADDMWTMCRWHVDNICHRPVKSHSHVIRTSSAHQPHIVHMSSTWDFNPKNISS